LKNKKKKCFEKKFMRTRQGMGGQGLARPGLARQELQLFFYQKK